jgi:hypothetical protein
VYTESGEGATEYAKSRKIAPELQKIITVNQFLYQWSGSARITRLGAEYALRKLKKP